MKQRARARMMVIAAWGLALLTSSPQAFIFRVIKHEEKDFYDCTTFNFFENLATKENSSHLTFYSRPELIPFLIIFFFFSAVDVKCCAV